MSHTLRNWIIAISLSVIIGGAIALFTLYQIYGTYRIRYRVSGPAAPAEIQYYSGDTLFSRTSLRQETITLPWEQAIRSDNFLHRRYALLFVRGDEGAAITCEVWINDHLAEELTGDGEVGCGYDPERNPVP